MAVELEVIGVEWTETLIWTTSDGRRFAVHEMYRAHIVNCIRVMEVMVNNPAAPETQRANAQHALDVFHAELDRRNRTIEDKSPNRGVDYDAR